MSRPRRDRTEALLERLPASIAYRIDLRRPGMDEALGGPFNGQLIRQQVVRQMFEDVAFDLVVETGTYRGTSTAFLRTLTAAPIVTIEINPRYERYARSRLAGLSDILVRGGDSPTEIRRIRFGPRGAAAHRPFFYLDAHWARRLPLRWELLEVTTGWPGFCAVIDDFRVPDDPGYRFDRYGPGFVLEPSLFDGLDLSGVARFWPAAASATETGKKRGWIVLARGQEMIAGLRANIGLREDIAGHGRDVRDQGDAGLPHPPG